MGEEAGYGEEGPEIGDWAMAQNGNSAHSRGMAKRDGMNKRGNALVKVLFAIPVCIFLLAVGSGIVHSRKHPSSSTRDAAPLTTQETIERTCQYTYIMTSDKPMGELSIKQSETIGDCKTLGLYHQ